MTQLRATRRLSAVHYAGYAGGSEPLDGFMLPADRFTELLRSTGEWSDRHPWLLTFLPGSAAESIALDVLRELTPDDLGTHGLVLFYPLATDKITTPLFRVPGEDVVFAFNLIRFVSHEHATFPNSELYRQLRAAGGVLYPPSALPLTSEDWQEHFGPLWPELRRAKKRFDPMNVLTPGYELFERTVELGPPGSGVRPH